MSNFDGGYGGYEGYGDMGGGYGDIGGGFDPMGGGYIQDGNDSAKKNDKKGKNESIFPLTVKQISQATTSDGNGFEIYNTPVGNVKIMGFIENFEEHSTNKNYVINDGTGSIQCILYNSDTAVNYQKFAYVKAFGSIRNIDGENKLMTFHMMELKNLDEMTYHLLDCIHTYCKLTKPEKSTYRGLTTPQGNNLGRQLITTHKVTNNAAKDAVLTVIQNPTIESEEGTSIESIFESLQGKYSRDEIRRLCIDLCSEGTVYSTIDEDHFLFC